MLHITRFFIFFIINCGYLGLNAEQIGYDQPTKFGLVNQVCAVVESEQPILQSDVEKRAKERSITHFQAQTELIGERALWIYAKQQLKFNVPEIHRNAQEHIKKIMENNKLSKEGFEELLMSPPYSMTFKQYEKETAFLILKNQLESSIAGSLEISDKEIEAEYKRQDPNKFKDFEVIFISILPQQNTTSSKALLNTQFIKANQIKKEILANNNLDIIKRKYKIHKDVSFVGPLDYQEGAFQQKYDIQIKKDLAAKITDPFEDDGVVTMIWKLEKKAASDNQKTALENVRKDLYRRAVQRRLEDFMKNILVKSSVEINCEW